MNWLDPPHEQEEASVDENDGADESTLNYWAHRLLPLHDPSPSFSMEGMQEMETGREVVFVACNRVGVEEGT